MVFGSVVCGEAGPTSDVDAAHGLCPGRRLSWEIEDLADELAEIFGRPVDLVSSVVLRRRMQAAVLAEAQSLYGR